MSTLKLTYDGDQHATALREPFQNTVAIDCPITAKGDEFSPGNLLGISVAGCMLLSMGAVAQRDHLDLSGTVIMVFDIPQDFSAKDRQKLERAAGLCPIKRSFRDETIVTATYNYAVAKAA
jgi:uncharacterized OsmC-like protein